MDYSFKLFIKWTGRQPVVRDVFWSSQSSRHADGESGEVSSSRPQNISETEKTTQMLHTARPE